MPGPLPPNEPTREPAQSAGGEQERPPMHVSFRAFRPTEKSPLPPHIRTGMKASLQRQEAFSLGLLNQGKGMLTDDEDRISGAAMMNALGWETFRDALGMNEEHPNHRGGHPADAGIFVVATDTSGAILGFSSALLNEKKAGIADTQPSNSELVSDPYTGVNPEDEYQGRGIGLRCAAVRNMLLFREGVRTYQTSVWEGSIHMYERSGLDMTALAGLPTESPTGQNQQKYRIDLDGAKLDALATQLGIDPTQDPLTTPIEQDLK